MGTHGRQFVWHEPDSRFSETAMALIERRVRANGRPTYRVRVKHLGRVITSTHPDRHSAVQWAAETEARVLKEGPRDHEANKRRLMRELIDRYEEYVLPLKRNGPNQRHQLQWWRDRIGKIPVERVSRSLISQCRDELGKPDKGGKVRGPATVVRYLAVLSHLFSVAIGDWEWADSNPVRGIRKPKEPRGRDRYLSELERTKLLEVDPLSRTPYR
jgi:hypothetical protein